MSKPWERDDCADMRAQYAVFSIPEAAARWCGVPEAQLAAVLQEVQALSNSGLGRSIWTHPTIPCIEPRSRAIAEAIEDGSLPHGREDGRPVSDDHVAYERRHFFGRDLKQWMEKAFPNQRPAFLFDEIEQDTHSAISADAYRALKADRDAARLRNENAVEHYRALREEKDVVESERDQLKAMVDKLGVPGERSETTYQNIIAALLACLAGELPDVERHPSLVNEAAIIDAIDGHFRGYGGLSKSNLSRKFPAAKRALRSQ